MSVEFEEINDNEGLRDFAGLSIAPYPLTLLCHMQVTATGSGTQRNLLIAGPNTMLFSIWSNAIDIRVQARDESARLSSPSTDLISNYTAGQWYAAALVMEDATTYSTYIDGSQVEGGATWPNSFDLTGSPSNLSALYIGSWGGSQRSDSRMGHVAIWSDALDQDQCEALTAGASPLLHPNSLEFYWQAMSSVLGVTVDSLTTLKQGDAAENADLVLNDNPQIIFPE